MGHVCHVKTLQSHIYFFFNLEVIFVCKLKMENNSAQTQEKKK